MDQASALASATPATRVTTREIAAAHGVSLRTAQRWAKAGKLAAQKVAGRWVITLTAPGLDGFKPFQLDKAAEAIEQGAILATSRPHVYRAISSDGTTVYLASPDGCSCPAGLKARRCYHIAAVRILLAARTSRRAA
ncbi:helix-turn-helix domain-containing protein [Streptosporangium sandarakinum]|uniref:helix-turn-helix domain-containing protein n=1 Tax=Streptosporangium sandarakinum TaxID=1260955 RepID=UPI0036CB2F73